MLVFPTYVVFHFQILRNNNKTKIPIKLILHLINNNNFLNSAMLSDESV